MIKRFEQFNESEKESLFSITKPPHELPDAMCPSVFLAGSIEMGKAVDWQSQIQDIMKNENVSIYNPRRDDWNSDLKQTIEDPDFREQVEWELNALEKATVVVMYLDPATKSPISLLELGLYAQSGKLMVCCPEGFFRKGNVDIVCARYGVPMFNNVEELAAAAIVKIKK